MIFLTLFRTSELVVVILRDFFSYFFLKSSPFFPLKIALKFIVFDRKRRRNFVLFEKFYHLIVRLLRWMKLWIKSYLKSCKLIDTINYSYRTTDLTIELVCGLLVGTENKNGNHIFPTNSNSSSQASPMTSKCRPTTGWPPHVSVYLILHSVV